MKTKIFAILIIAALAAACISTQAVLLDPSAKGKYPPVSWMDVKLYLDEKDVPGEYEKIGIIKAEGTEGFTTEEKMYAEMKKQAGLIGANGIILESMKDPGDIERMANALAGGWGLGSRKGRAIAIRVK